jgi:hypothetical protein
MLVRHRRRVLVARKSSPKPAPKVRVVQYQFQDRTYQIDPDRRKVYRSFVEIETSKAFEIYTTWRAQKLTV